MTKATEIKLEDDRIDAENRFCDKSRGLTLVPTAKSVSRGRPFTIAVEGNIYSPRVVMVDRSGSTGADKRRSDAEPKPSDHRQGPGILQTVGTVGIFIAAGVLGFLIGGGRD